MTPFIYITASLLLYPLIGWLTVKRTNRFPKIQNKIVRTLCVYSALIILGLATHIITISQNLNWFLLTSIYLTVSVLLWTTQYNAKTFIEKIGAVLMSIIIIGGYIIAIIGFPFIFMISLELGTNQRKWLGDDLIYNEWNIGQGPDPSVRLKKVEIYKRVKLFPVLAYLVKTKTYDEWSFPLQRELTVVFSEKDQTLYLTSVVNGYKVFNFSDTIKLDKKNYR